MPQEAWGHRQAELRPNYGDVVARSAAAILGLDRCGHANVCDATPETSNEAVTTTLTFCPFVFQDAASGAGRLGAESQRAIHSGVTPLMLSCQNANELEVKPILQRKVL